MELDPETGEPKPKKRTRRGSRGGRGRKKKPTTTVAASGNGAEAETAADPDAMTDEPEVATAVAAPDIAAVELDRDGATEPTRPGAASDDGASADDYVPMSEWLDELEAETR